MEIRNGGQGLRVNMDKTKILVCRAKPVQSGKPSGKWPCGVCVKGLALTKFFALSVGSGYIKDVVE